jgi:hypothetical protein
MEPIKIKLCSNCTECPSVEITDQGVTIGEDANTVKLRHVQWNDLVARIKSGELGEAFQTSEMNGQLAPMSLPLVFAHAEIATVVPADEGLRANERFTAQLGERIVEVAPRGET